jgi:hypothetical protein
MQGGYTALHCACSSENWLAIEKLLLHGADATLRTTPFTAQQGLLPVEMVRTPESKQRFEVMKPAFVPSHG